METFTICFRARLKKGWVEWVPSCFSARFTHPETWFLPPFFSSLKQRIPSGKGCFFFSLQTLCESSERPNPPVVQKRDPRTFPRFALKKVLACLQHSMFDFLVLRKCNFSTVKFDQKIKSIEEFSLRDVWRLIYVYIYVYIYIYTYDLYILSK